MTSIKIFLASSNELVNDRKAIAEFLADRNKYWKDQRGIFLELVNWEDYIDTVSHTRLQDEYNKGIESADLFIMLFWTKVGMYTNEEFDTALKAFKNNDKPLLLTYLKEEPSATGTQDSLQQFKDKLNDLGHFPTIYKNIEGLLLHLGKQLDKIYQVDTPVAQQKELRSKPDKAELVRLIGTGDLLTVFEMINEYYDGQNDSLNNLQDEFIDRPNNFNIVDFKGRLRLLISKNWR